MKQLAWTALAVWGAIALASRAAFAADSGEPNEEPAAFRDFCLAAKEQLEVFLDDDKLEDAAEVFRMMVGAGERAHAEAEETKRHFDQMGERRYLEDQELFETREKVRPLCVRVRGKLPRELKQEFRRRHEEAAAAGVTIGTVGCAATERLSRFIEACVWYDSRAANKLEWPSEADERARLLKAGRAGFEEFCLKARFDVENFLSAVSERKSSYNNLDERVKAMQNGVMIGRRVRTLTSSTGRNAREIKTDEVDYSRWYIESFAPRVPNLCATFKWVRPTIYGRLSGALEEQKAALQAGGQSADSLADITFENVSCAATDGLILFQEGCYWWYNRPKDPPRKHSPAKRPKPRPTEPEKKKEFDWTPFFWFWVAAWASG